LRIMRIFAAFLFFSFASFLFASDAPYDAMGEKVGEVTHTSAIVHTRLTAHPNTGAGRDIPTGRAVPGQAGRVRLEYSKQKNFNEYKLTPWAVAGAETDFTHQFVLEGLEPYTTYYYRVHMSTLDGSAVRVGDVRDFRTAPEPDVPKNVSFVAITGQGYRTLDDPKGHNSFVHMGQLKPDFIVPTGDNVYYDARPGPRGVDLPTCRFHWHRMYSLPRLVEFYSHVPGYWEKDDHDYRFDDADPHRRPERGPTHEQGIRIFLEQHPIQHPTYRTFRWGKLLQIWCPEGRDYRSNNATEDGPEKTIWGAEQKEWLKQGILNSDAAFKILVSPTPLIGPDRITKRDNHANPRGYMVEGTEFLNWLKESKVKNFYIACGDRHWKYHSIHHASGYQEFCSGALTDTHAVRNPEYSREGVERVFVEGTGGFLNVRVKQRDEGSELPVVIFDLYNSNGEIVYSHKEPFQE
jgi:phosphodiesterase/alkaline phosphatase D-like protein